MTKQEAVMHYKAAVAVFKQWLSEGIITEDEFNIINTITAEDYGISLSSIFFEIRKRQKD
jgi:hypothetical protein